MSNSDKPQEWSLAGATIRTAAAIVIVFGLAVALGWCGNWLVGQGHTEADGLDYRCLLAVSGVAKVCESLGLIAIIIKHAVGVMAAAFEEICTAIQKAMRKWKELKS